MYFVVPASVAFAVSVFVFDISVALDGSDVVFVVVTVVFVVALTSVEFEFEANFTVVVAAFWNQFIATFAIIESLIDAFNFCCVDNELGSTDNGLGSFV